MSVDQLNSWKEVARHLGCSVRTVQRWEKERGLPVRRIPGERGAVFAVRAEVDAWRDGAVGQLASGEEEPATDTSQIDGRGPRRWWGVAALPLIVAAGLAAWLAVSRGDAQRRVALAFVLERNEITAHDSGGRRVWSHDFGKRVAPLDFTWRPTIGEWVQRDDLDGDGVDEVIALVGHPDVNGVIKETVHVFTADGRLRWSYSPAVTLDFGGRLYSGPWVLLDYEVVPGNGVWVSISDHQWWPSAVLQIDNAGHVSTRFVQPGHTRVLRVLSEEGRTLVAAAGVNNEWGAANVALLDPNIPASAPQRESGPYRCGGCPAEKPLHYVLFSPSPLSVQVKRPYNTAVDMFVGPTLLVSTYESQQAQVLYTLTRGLDVLSAEPSDGYWSAIANSNASPHDTEVEIRTWSPQGWSSSHVKYGTIGRAVTRPAARE